MEQWGSVVVPCDLYVLTGHYWIPVEGFQLKGQWVFAWILHCEFLASGLVDWDEVPVSGVDLDVQDGRDHRLVLQEAHH